MRTSLLVLLCVSFLCSCQKANTPPPIENNKALTWAKTFGGSDYEYAYSAIQNADGSYVIAGVTRSTNGDIGASVQSYDAWVVKIDISGNKVWSKTFGGSNDDYAHSIAPTTDGGYIVAGYTYLNDNSDSAWIAKIDGSGKLQWRKFFSGSTDIKANAIVASKDGGFLVAGSIFNGGTAYDGWVTKIDNSGNTQWTKTYGGSGNDYINTITQGTDGNYAIAGYTKGGNEAISEKLGNNDGWVCKIDAAGSTIWKKNFGGSNDDYINAIIASPDGGYVFAGSTKSSNNDLSTNNGSFDEWIVKLDASGIKQWSKTYGGNNDDIANSIVASTDGGYIIAGSTNSTNGDVTRTHGDYDGLVIKLDGNGNKTVISSYGGSNDDYTNSIIKTADNGYLLIGYTFLNNNGYDVMISKTGTL